MYGIYGEGEFNKYFDLYTVLCLLSRIDINEELKNVIIKEFCIIKEKKNKLNLYVDLVKVC